MSFTARSQTVPGGRRRPGMRLQLAWADAALRELRRELPTEGLRARVADPTGPRPWLTPAIAGWLRIRRATCLERSLIMQRWLLGLGRPHDLLIGVESAERSGGIIAHAWLDHEDPRGHEILVRVPPDASPPA